MPRVGTVVVVKVIVVVVISWCVYTLVPRMLLILPWVGAVVGCLLPSIVPAAVAGSPVPGLGRRPGSPPVLAAEYQGNRGIAGTDYVTSIPFLGARRLPHDFKTCVSPFYANQM